MDEATTEKAEAAERNLTPEEMRQVLIQAVFDAGGVKSFVEYHDLSPRGEENVEMSVEGDEINARLFPADKEFLDALGFEEVWTRSYRQFDDTPDREES